MSDNNNKDSNKFGLKNSFEGKSQKFSKNKFTKNSNNKGYKKDYYEKEKTPSDEYIIFGKHPVLEALKNESREKLKLYATKNSLNWLKENIDEKNLEGIDTQICEPGKIENIIANKVSDGKILHQGLALRTKFLSHYNYVNLLSLDKIIVLDGISDPHNVGAIIRSAKAFGFDAVLSAERNSPEESATICKTSAGVIEKMPYKRVGSLNNHLQELKENGFTIYGLDGNTSEFLTSNAATQKLALVVGSEGKGLSPHVKKLCDNILKIKISEEVESLNASVACAVAMNLLS